MNRSLILRLAALMVVFLPIQSPAAGRPDATAEAAKFESDFSLAMARNDIASLREILAREWKIVGSDGHVITRERFLDAIASGDLKHVAMSSQDQSIRLYGDTAIITSRSRSGGSYKRAARHLLAE